MGHGSTGVGHLDSLLERANAALERATTQAAGFDAPKGTGSSSDGLIQVRVAPGRLRSLQVDPQALRWGAAELAAEIQAAVNRAFDALATGDDDEEPPADAARSAGESLAAELRDIQNESVRGMAMFVGAMQDVVTRIERDREQ